MTTDTKRQPLPWFALNVGEYVKDTMRLSRDCHGAYFLLMLDYYGTAKPCPDDNFILAALTKSTDEEWVKIRKVLAPFFDIREGYWYHKRIEREMHDACARHAASSEHAAKAAHAMHEKRRAKEAKDAETASKSPRSTRRAARADAPALQSAMPEQIPEHTQKHKHPSITEGGEKPPAPKAIEQVQGIGSPITAAFKPIEQTIERAHDAGLTDDDIDAEVRKFIGRKLNDGAFSHDWQGSFAEWIEREIKHRKKAPARIEVNSKPSGEPAPINWDYWLKMFKRDQSKWSFATCGPEPGHAGCKVPVDKLREHGLVKEPAS